VTDETNQYEYFYTACSIARPTAISMSCASSPARHETTISPANNEVLSATDTAITSLPLTSKIATDESPRMGHLQMNYNIRVTAAG